MATDMLSGVADALQSATLSTATAAFAIATAASTSPFDPAVPPFDPTFDASKGPHNQPPPNGECRLLGPFALLVQGGLGFLALSVLLIKRYRERPQRPLKIWAFDASKQVVGSVLVHVANLVMSMLSSGQFNMAIKAQEIVGGGEGGVVGRAILGRALGLMIRAEDESGVYQPNPCSFYLLNLAIDTTIGIPILIILLRIFTGLLSLTAFGNPTASLKSGVYAPPGEAPRYSWWMKQCVVYFMGLMGMKFVVLLIFLILPWISKVGDWALRWTEGNEELQVFFVMMFFPLIMNATQYYIIDTFIKNQNPDAEHEPLAQEDDAEWGGDGSGEQTLISDESDSEAEGEEEAVKGRHKEPVEVKTKNVKRGGPGDRHTYDEDYDGESSPTVVGSGSSLLQREVGKEPKRKD